MSCLVMHSMPEQRTRRSDVVVMTGATPTALLAIMPHAILPGHGVNACVRALCQLVGYEASPSLSRGDSIYLGLTSLAACANPGI
jgi:hypothetical protein